MYVFSFFLPCFSDLLPEPHLITIFSIQILLTCLFLCLQEAPACQDILVFLTGQEEIEAMTKTCRDVAQHLPEGCPRMTVLPLYASLPHSQQLRAFKPTPEVREQHLWLVCFHEETHGLQGAQAVCADSEQ